MLKSKNPRHTRGQALILRDRLALVGRDDFAAFVMPTAGAYSVRQTHLTTIGALHQVGRFQKVVCTAAITATFGDLSFWKRTHNLLL